MADFDLIGGTRIAEFVTSNRPVDIIQGPLGSGKTRGLCARVMRHAQEQVPSPVDGVRYTRFALVRNTVPDLVRTTIRTWLEMFPERTYGRYIGGAVKQHQIRFLWNGTPVHCDVDFISLDKEEDVRKLRSTEYTGIAFNELPFIIRDLFVEARSRLRYPAPEHGGPSPWRGVLGDANAPDEDHWLAIMTGQVELPVGLPAEDLASYQWPPDWGFHMQPPALLESFDDKGAIVGYTVNPAAENLANLPAGYYEEQIVGAPSKAWIDSRLMNRVALVVEGQAVWPMFRREYHVAREALKPVEGHDVVVSLDFGRVYPAALFAQEINQRLFVQYEILGFNEPATVFAPRVKKFLETHYRGHNFRMVGDPKGADKGQQTEQSSYDIFKANGMAVTPAPVKQNNIEERTEAVAYALNDNPAGRNYMVISPACRTLIVGMAGRYHLEKEEKGDLKPKKDKYSNLCDALQYLVIGLGVARRMIGLKPSGDVKPVRIARPRRSMRRVA
jgi:hypothetical protein